MADDTAKTRQKQKIALGVSGGIACYKSAEILRRLQDRGFDVVVIMTPNARRFVTPLTFAALSGNKVYSDMFEGASPGAAFEGSFDHIFLAQSVNLFLVAPATADCIARMASGIANNFLTTFHLAFESTVVIAPAMNTQMWRHPAVQSNLSSLRQRGVRVIDPDVGEMACGTYGPGRLADVDHIVEYVVSVLERRLDLKDKRVLVTAGPTVEDIDPVRFISNRSSGKMGFAVARAVTERGGEVTLISGPTELEFPGTIRIRTTGEMRDAVLEHLPGADVVVKAAAPLDFRPADTTRQKIKKGSGLDVRFEPTPDILGEIGNAKNGTVLVGFAAETENHIEFGLEKLRSKNLDLIVINGVSGPDSAFDGDTSQASIVDSNGVREDLPLMSKVEVAHRIIDRVIPFL
jgi:phosphopantothenoylcysteine decarboxylase/phosphopantothenate--cysteine ligase